MGIDPRSIKISNRKGKQLSLNLTEEQRQAVATAALEAAKKRGYCDETKKVLRDLGLPTEVQNKTIKALVELEFEVPNNGHSVIVSTERLSYHSQSGLGKLVGVTVKDGKPVNRGLRD